MMWAKVHERGSPETLRDPRGFAVKFYTREGNFDMVGNNMPVSGDDCNPGCRGLETGMGGMGDAVVGLWRPAEHWPQCDCQGMLISCPALVMQTVVAATAATARCFSSVTA
jgi:hypothetical protein